jgi:glycosyltransferase involved in cell wall biosynthesis
MHTPMFSIVVPVYKVEKYLLKCLESIKSQTYSNYEVILVDDGSPDQCPAICDRFAQTDSRYKVIHQLNKGLSGARNTGLQMAKGRYIYFLDSDDTIADDLLERMEKIFHDNDVDIVGFSATVVTLNGTSILTTGNCKNEKEAGIEIAKKRTPLSTVPLYCYRRDFLIEKNISFKEGIYYEDVLFTALVFLENPKIYYIDEKLYFYNKREDSITTTKTKEKNYYDIVEICKTLIELNVAGWNSHKKMALKNIIKSYILLGEEIYRSLSSNDRAKVADTRWRLLETVKTSKKKMGWKNYMIACFPNIIYTARAVRRKIK